MNKRGSGLHYRARGSASRLHSLDATHAASFSAQRWGAPLPAPHSPSVIPDPHVDGHERAALIVIRGATDSGYARPQGQLSVEGGRVLWALTYVPYSTDLK